MADLEYELRLANSDVSVGDVRKASAVISRLKTLDFRNELPSGAFFLLELIVSVRKGDKLSAVQLADVVFGTGLSRDRVREMLLAVPEAASQDCREFILSLTAELEVDSPSTSVSVSADEYSKSNRSGFSKPALILLVFSGIILFALILVGAFVYLYPPESFSSDNSIRGDAQIESNEPSREGGLNKSDPRDS